MFLVLNCYMVIIQLFIKSLLSKPMVKIKPIYYLILFVCRPIIWLTLFCKLQCLCHMFQSNRVSLEIQLPLIYWISIFLNFINIILVIQLVLPNAQRNLFPNKSWKPECAGSFNMGWLILVFYPEPDARDKIY